MSRNRTALPQKRPWLDGYGLNRGNVSVVKFDIADIISFDAVLTSYDTIPDESAVLFNVVLLNEGEG